MKQKTTIVSLLYAFFLILPGTLLFAEEHQQAPVTYGELFLEEERKTSPAPWRVNLGMGYDLSNPYNSIWSISASVERQFGRHFRVGTEFRRFQTSKTRLTEQVETALSSQGITQSISSPDHSGYLKLTISPFIGHLNLFSATTLPFEVFAQLGIGYVQYQSQDIAWGTLLWGLGIESEVSRRWVVQVSFDQENESLARERANSRTAGRLSLGFRI